VLIFTQQIMKFLASIQQDSLLCSQKRSSRTFPGAVKFRPHPQTLSLYVSFSYHPPVCVWISHVGLVLWEDCLKMELKTGCEELIWINLAEDGFQWQAFEKTLIKFKSRSSEFLRPRHNPRRTALESSRPWKPEISHSHERCDIS
jgi:hypothetical protein